MTAGRITSVPSVFTLRSGDTEDSYLVHANESNDGRVVNNKSGTPLARYCSEQKRSTTGSYLDCPSNGYAIPFGLRPRARRSSRFDVEQ